MLNKGIKKENDQQLKNVCQTIKNQRTKHQLSWEEIAEKSGVPLAILINISNEIVTDDFTIDMLFAICGLFDLHLSEYFKPHKYL